MINLSINKLKGNLKFKRDNLSYYKPVGHCIYSPQLGYMALNGSNYPYIPSGGEKALNQIIDGINPNDFDWLQPIS